MPVISVGNVTVGGVGKTPFIMYMAQHLKSLNYKPAVILRGYGRQSTKTIVLLPEQFLSLRIPEYGDEAALLSFLLDVPVGIGADRITVAEKLLDKTDCDVILLDDGFQHMRLQRDVDIVLLDGKKPFGNGRCLPYGPLREFPSTIRYSNIVIYRGNNAPTIVLDPSENEWFLGNLQWERILPFQDWKTKKFEKGDSPARFASRTVTLLSGVGDPSRFQNQAKEYGFDIHYHFAFPDHHWFTPRDLNQLISKPFRNYPVLTTEKDAIRLLSIADQFPIDNPSFLYVIQAKWHMNEEFRFQHYVETWLHNRKQTSKH